MIGARKKDLGEAAAAELRDHGDVSVLQLDVADHKSVTAAAEDVKSKFGHLDVLVSCKSGTQHCACFQRYSTISVA